MKNALFATTGLVALGVAGAASANEPVSIKTTGYLNAGAGIISGYDSGNALLIRDGEISFVASTTTDNGLTFMGRVELEVYGDQGDGDIVDENYVTVSGSFGKVMIGGNDTAYTASMIGYAGPSYGGYYDQTSATGQAIGPDQFDDSMSIQYYTPSFSGFSAGVSYTPVSPLDKAADRPIAVRPDDGATDKFTFGAKYEGEFDGFSVGLGGGYATWESAGDDIDGWHIGGYAGTAGFTLLAQYEDGNTDTDEAEFAIGGTYGTGPWTFGIGYSAEIDGSRDFYSVGGWVTYALAPGVDVSASFDSYSADDIDDSFTGYTWVSLAF